VVIPVYNEEKNIATLIRDWSHVFGNTGIPYHIILIDDGSKDQSLSLIRQMQDSHPFLFVHTQSNAGHGPSILKGYRMALGAEWIFQIDSDHQIETTTFQELWNNRDRYDFLLAERKEKNATLLRQYVSRISSLLVHLLYGHGVNDVNSPFRLMRSSRLQEALDKIPEGSFAPNILLTSWFVLKKSRIFTTIAEVRRAGLPRQSKMNSYFLKGALKSALQTIVFRIKL
jgi:glycosyltransferase involved in cell wall biosynthesis